MVTRLTDELEETEETAALGVSSRLLQLDFAWRVGMERDRARRLVREAEEIATRTGDSKSLAMLRMLQFGRPGLEQTTGEWVAGVEEAHRLARESGEEYLEVAIRAAGSYAYLGAGDFAGFERAADEVIEMAGDDLGAGAGIIVGCPVAWAYTAKAIVARERRDFEESERLLDRGVRIAEEQGDPETVTWGLNTRALLLAWQGEAEAGVAVGRESVQQTEKLGDVFSRSLALGNLAAAQVHAGDHRGALESIEEAERLYREAMDTGGELEAWRGGVHAEALTGAGRPEEGIEKAAWAVGVARERELRWSLPLCLLALARGRAAAGRDGVEEALDEAEEAARAIGAEGELMLIERGRAEVLRTQRTAG
jgi:tetratricopeptide (TPR) repeat protein